MPNDQVSTEPGQLQVVACQPGGHVNREGFTMTGLAVPLLSVVWGGVHGTAGYWGSSSSAFTISRGSSKATSYTLSDVPRFTDMLLSPSAFASR